MTAKITQVDLVKARLNPKLNEPYFTVVERYHVMANKGCLHENKGATLHEIDRTVTCNGCGTKIDPFDALLHYAASEKRLVSTLHQIEQHAQAEAAKKEREKARKPFLRAVKSRKSVHDKKLKAEPIVGYVVTLECGHTKKTGTNKFKNLTCYTCQAEATSKNVGRTP